MNTSRQTGTASSEDEGERRSDADTTVYGLAPEHDREIPSELAHMREEAHE